MDFTRQVFRMGATNLQQVPAMLRSLLVFLPCLLTAQALPGPAHIQTFQTTAKAVKRGGSVTLSWSATGADQVRLDPLGLILPAKGELTHLVTGRMVYWLHVTNASGGQSAPLVVDLLPEEAAPSLPAPSLPALPAAQPVLPALTPEAPRLAKLPAVPLQAPVLPVALPMAPPRRLARRHGPRHVWIQFAVTVSAKGAARIQRNLQRVAATDSTLQVRTRRSGRPYHLVRNGPFPSVQAARLRLQELAPVMQALNMKPIIVLGPYQAQPLTLGTTFVADARQPEGR